jgi:hypothetical protein
VYIFAILAFPLKQRNKKKKNRKERKKKEGMAMGEISFMGGGVLC